MLRGVLHLVAAFAAAAGTAWLLVEASSARAYVGAAIFGASLILLYSTSATYHRVWWPAGLRGIIKRLDHAMIFVLIAGTYTPFCLIVAGNAWGISILSVVWGIAGGGILVKMAWPHAPRWFGVLWYVMLGWTALVAGPQLFHWFGPLPLSLLGLGGLLYTIGGIVYALGRPDPWPRVFGYHEIFHAFTVGGSAVHFAIVAAVVMTR